MRKNSGDLDVGQAQISFSEFLESYNRNMPSAFPRATVVLMKKFKEDNVSLFKHGDLWSLEQHRKRLMDWIPRNAKFA